LVSASAAQLCVAASRSREDSNPRLLRDREVFYQLYYGILSGRPTHCFARCCWRGWADFVPCRHRMRRLPCSFLTAILRQCNWRAMAVAAAAAIPLGRALLERSREGSSSPLISGEPPHVAKNVTVQGLAPSANRTRAASSLSAHPTTGTRGRVSARATNRHMDPARIELTTLQCE
jgi:hypothetical protein